MANSTSLLTCRAVLLRKIDYRDSDLMVTIFTDVAGKLSAVARGARKSKKRFVGSLEPIHTLSLEISEPSRNAVCDLRAARLETVRQRLTQDLGRLQAAARALGWVRQATPEKSPEPLVWRILDDLLDDLNSEGAIDETQVLAVSGLKLLVALGWRLDFDACIRCGKRCPPGKSAMIAASKGGLICSDCGGASTRVSGKVRARLAAAAAGKPENLAAEDATLALKLTDEALSAHADIS